MPTLDWMGKDKVITYHRQVPYQVLEKVPSKGVLDSHGSDCGNMVIHGDNLEALKTLLPEYEGQVDCCIYIDPPTIPATRAGCTTTMSTPPHPQPAGDVHLVQGRQP